MRLAVRLVLAGWIAALAVAAHAAAPVWFTWSAGKDGKTHTYAAGGYRLTLTSRPVAKDAPPVPVLTVAAPGAPPLTLTGVGGFPGNAVALVGVVKLDPKAARPAVLMQTFSGGAHCCTTLKLGLLTDGAWRAYEMTFDGDPGKAIVDTTDGAPPVLLISDGNFDYAFASHAGSYLLERAYAVRGGRLYDISGEARMAARRRDAMGKTLVGCSATTPDRNGACAAYVAAASLLGKRAAAWRKMLTIYDRTGNVWPNGCRVDPANGCPKDQVLESKSYTASLAWFLWRYGYSPPAPTFECLAPNCPVAWPSSPPPAGDGPIDH
jgi:hypothetical protein